MKLGVCCSPEEAQSLPVGVVDFIEVNVQRDLVPEQEEAGFRPLLDRMAALPLPVYSANCFLPATLKSTGPEADLDRIEAYAAVAFARARQVGIQIIVFGSGGSRQVPDGFPMERAREQLIEVLARIAPVAAGHQVTLVVEPLGRGECNFIHTLAEGAEVVRAVAHPAVRLLADFYHMAWNDEPAENLAMGADLLAHTHVAEKARRTAPGQDGDDFRPHIRQLAAAGYLGAIAMECHFPGGLNKDLPRAVEALRGMGA